MILRTPLYLLALGAFALAPTALVAQSSKKIHQLEDEGSDRPAPPMTPATSPRMIIPMGGYVSYQINVNANGQNILNDAANEPSMVIDPTNPNRIAVGWRQFNNVSSNFRQGGYAYSTNGGINWTFPGVIENNVFRSDPVLDSTLNGVFHYNSLQQTFFTDEFRSINQGQSWTKLGPATGGDKQWITIDKTASSGSGFVYQIWSTAGNNYNGRQFSRSTDGGTTWMNPINLPNQPVWGTLDVGQNGDLYIVGTDGSQPSLRFLRSTNARNGAVTPTFDRSVFVDMGGDLSYGITPNPDGLAGQAWIAADRSPGSPFLGNIYILASVDPSGTASRIDVRMRRSLDGGATWQPVKTVNDDGSVNGRFHWFGTLSVAPNGRVDVCWLDTRHDSTGNTSKLYYTYSMDGGVTFVPNIEVSPSFNSRIGWPNQSKIGDYMAMSSDNGGANIVYPATFSGGQDVYFVRVPLTTTETVAPSSFTVNLGQVQSGNTGSLAADDNNPLVLCKFFVPNLSSPIIQYFCDGTTGVSSPSALAFRSKVKAVNAGAYQQTMEMFNFQTSAYEENRVDGVTLAYQTFELAGTGTLSRYVGAAGALRGRLKIQQTGPSTALLPCMSTEFVNWNVTN